jgi:hypothetical protein
MLLKRTLLVNGLATALTGLAALAGAPWLPSLLGPTSPALLAIIGAGLLVFAGVLLSQARRDTIDPRVAWTIAAMDVAWVMGSVAVLEAGILTVAGNVVVAAVAAVVLLFALLEIRGARGLRAAGA